MRTTINVDEHLLIELKTVAAQSGRTLTAVIEDALRQSLVRRDRGTPTRRPRLPTISGGGLQPGVDLDDNSALLDLMEGIGPLILLDVNVLVYALVVETPDHQRYRDWLDAMLATDELVGLSDLVLSGFIRVVTNPRVLRTPVAAREAIDVVDTLRGHPNVTIVGSGDRHWPIFRRLCIAVNAKGNLVSDAFHAALAIESGAEFITTDRDFSRFEGLRWRHPLAG